MSFWTLAFCTSLAGLAALLAYGIVTADLLEQDIWSSEGLDKLIWYACAYAAAATVLVSWRPR